MGPVLGFVPSQGFPGSRAGRVLAFQCMAVLLSTACSTLPGSPEDPPGSSEAALVRTLEDSLVLRLVDRDWRGLIPMRISNRTTSPLWVFSCLKRLDLLSGSAWVTAFRPACLSVPPERIAAGDSLDTVLSIRAATDPETYPRFETGPHPGTYSVFLKLFGDTVVVNGTTMPTAPYPDPMGRSNRFRVVLQ